MFWQLPRRLRKVPVVFWRQCIQWSAIFFVVVEHVLSRWLICLVSFLKRKAPLARCCIPPHLPQAGGNWPFKACRAVDGSSAQCLAMDRRHRVAVCLPVGRNSPSFAVLLAAAANRLRPLHSTEKR